MASYGCTVEWKRGEYIRLDRNTSYWKRGRPHLGNSSPSLGMKGRGKVLQRDGRAVRNVDQGDHGVPIDDPPVEFDRGPPNQPGGPDR